MASRSDGQTEFTSPSLEESGCTRVFCRLWPGRGLWPGPIGELVWLDYPGPRARLAIPTGAAFSELSPSHDLVNLDRRPGGSCFDGRSGGCRHLQCSADRAEIRERPGCGVE